MMKTMVWNAAMQTACLDNARVFPLFHVPFFHMDGHVFHHYL